MRAQDDILSLDDAAPASTANITEEPTGSQSHSDPTVGCDVEVAYSVALEYYTQDLRLDMVHRLSPASSYTILISFPLR